MDLNSSKQFTGEVIKLLRSELNVTYPFDFSVTFVAGWCDELFEAIFAIKLAVFFNEADVLQLTSASVVDADEMVGTPNASECSYERAPKKLHFVNKQKKYKILSL